MRWHYTRHRKMSPLAMAIVGFIVGALLLTGGIFMGTRGSHLDSMAASGQRVQGKVIGEREEKHTSRRRGRTRTSYDYYITVQFQHPDGRNITEEHEVASSVHSRYAQASAMNPVSTTVVVDPASPDEWMVEEQLQNQRSSANVMMWILPLIGLLFFGMGAFGTVQHIRKKNAPPQMADAYPPYPQQGGPVPYGQPQQYPQQPGQPQRYPQQPGQQPLGGNDNVIYDANRDT